ncbi:MAG: hypothetical protein QM484_06640 [Woeseiaceae bacterium]
MYFRIVLLLSFFISYPALSTENDFDKMCNYFKSLDIKLTSNKMTVVQKKEFIDALVVNNLQEDSFARKSWDVVTYAVPEERYCMIKSTAEELLKTDWKCIAMKKHISKTGK